MPEIIAHVLEVAEAQARSTIKNTTTEQVWGGVSVLCLGFL
jgi:hypothetical protein